MRSPLAAVLILAALLPLPLSAPAAGAEAPGHLVAYPLAPTALRASPGGSALATASLLTPFGSPETLAVLQARGDWLEVASTELTRPAWLPRRATRLVRVTTEIDVSLSQRRLRLRRGGHVVLTATVGVGATQSPTPLGRFFVTDRLRGRRYSAAYGCCILALNGRQTRLPTGWAGGDRLALHGTDSPQTIGAAASNGCLHLAATVLERLMRLVPLGTPVLIQR